MSENKTFLIYFLRWQASGLIMAPILWYLSGMNIWIATSIAQAIGAFIFFYIDIKILCRN